MTSSSTKARSMYTIANTLAQADLGWNNHKPDWTKKKKAKHKVTATGKTSNRRTKPMSLRELAIMRELNKGTNMPSDDLTPGIPNIITRPPMESGRLTFGQYRRVDLAIIPTDYLIHTSSILTDSSYRAAVVAMRNELKKRGHKID